MPPEDEEDEEELDEHVRNKDRRRVMRAPFTRRQLEAQARRPDERDEGSGAEEGGEVGGFVRGGMRAKGC